MGVVNLPGRPPTMRLTGGALGTARIAHPHGFVARIDLSITDDGQWRRPRRHFGRRDQPR